MPDALRRGPTALTAAGRSASLERPCAVRLTDWVPAEMLSTIDGERKARGGCGSPRRVLSFQAGRFMRQRSDRLLVRRSSLGGGKRDLQDVSLQRIVDVVVVTNALRIPPGYWGSYLLLLARRPVFQKHPTKVVLHPGTPVRPSATASLTM